MYEVGPRYPSYVKDNNRDWRVNVYLYDAYYPRAPRIILHDDGIQLGSLKYIEAVMANDAFSIGGAILSELSLSIINNGQYDDTQFIGMEIKVEVELFCGLEVVPEGEEAPEIWAPVPLGVFVVDEVSKTQNVVSV